MDLRTTGQCSRKIGQGQISPGATDLFPGTPRNGKTSLKYQKFMEEFHYNGTKYFNERKKAFLIKDTPSSKIDTNYGVTFDDIAIKYEPIFQISR